MVTAGLHDDKGVSLPLRAGSPVLVLCLQECRVRSGRRASVSADRGVPRFSVKQTQCAGSSPSLVLAWCGSGRLGAGGVPQLRTALSLSARVSWHTDHCISKENILF